MGEAERKVFEGLVDRNQPVFVRGGEVMTICKSAVCASWSEHLTDLGSLKDKKTSKKGLVARQRQASSLLNQGV